MSLLRMAAMLLAALGFEAGIGKWAPGYRAYLDVLMLPLVWYALARTQRSAMLVGCAGGLLEDVWFRGEVLGVTAFSKTLLGWALGGLGARFDLNVPLGRLLSAALGTIADALVQSGLLHLLDKASGPISPIEIGIRSITSGLLALVVFAILNRGNRGEPGRSPARRRA